MQQLLQNLNISEIRKDLVHIAFFDYGDETWKGMQAASEQREAPSC